MTPPRDGQNPGHPWDEPGFAYKSNISAADLAAAFGSASSVLITTHEKPDGDALGTSLALHRGLRQIGVRSWIVVAGPLDQSLLAIAHDDDDVRRFEQCGNPADEDEPDLVAVVDTGAWTQLDSLKDWLRPRVDRVVGVDHHARGGSVAGRRVVDTDCASATQALVPVLDAMGVDLAQDDVATPLFLGLATDTGWFRFSSAGPAVYRLAARLMESGVDKDDLYARIEQNATPARFAMIARALTSLSFVGNGAVAVMRLSMEDFAETGASLEGLAGIVNTPLEIGSVRASILLTEAAKGLTKASFRSKPASGGLGIIDVNELAARFGGGGHVHAAGARLSVDLQEAADAIEAELPGFLS
ncbi:MAG: DHH family phosphoesterase [Phycisphaerales bacterium]|nr:DHH family phosphoesterase [Phycisphaerales bacterium]